MSKHDLRFSRFGEQVTSLVRSLSAAKSWSMSRAMREICEKTDYGYDMVYRWRQGRACPSMTTVEILAQLGKVGAHLDREWGESLFRAARYPNVLEAVDKLWGPKEIRQIPCNLPTREHTDLIGRQSEIAFLLGLLSPRHAAHLITVDGIGGVGKTALVLEVAYRCLQVSKGELHDSSVPTFEAILYVSAKQDYLTPGGILPNFAAQRTLQDLYRMVAHTLERFEITHTVPEHQPTRTREALSRQQTLLIVDNLETMEDKQEILSFLYSLPPSVKVVVTTRERAIVFSIIRLMQLGEEEALTLIHRQALDKGAVISREEAQTLYQHIGGIPAALVYVVGQIASGYSVENVLGRIAKAGSDVAHFCFEGSVGPMREQPAYSLLMAMAMFPKPPSRTAIAHTAGLAGDLFATEDGLAKLQQLSLVSQQKGRYEMLPLTREYALAELTAHIEFEQKARWRWVEWYLNFTEEYGGRDWKEWHTQFDQVEEEWDNLLAVFSWCAFHERYDEMRAFWQGGGVCQLAHVYGYWDDKLIWLTWIIESAEGRGDWPTLVEALKDKAYTLTLMGNLDQADGLFKRAWDLHEYATPQVQVYLAQEFAAYLAHRRKFLEAVALLDQAESLLKGFSLGDLESTRAHINSQRYYGFLHYEQEDYSQAERYFQDVVECAEAIGWQRAVTYAQSYLAHIAIHKGNLDEAERLIQQGLTISERNKDKRRTAAYKRCCALLQQKLGNWENARFWAREACDVFERLGMQADADEMYNLLQKLQAKI